VGTIKGSRRRSVAAGVVALVVALAAAGCGSSSSSNSASSGGSSSSSASSGGSSSSGGGGTIKVGTLIPLTGTGLNFPDYLAGAKAAVESINNAGGVNGKKIDLIECDDQNNPNQAAACARNMVSDHVVAVAGGVSLFGAQEAEVLKAAGIPWVGALPIVAQETSLSNEYPIESGNIGNYGTVGYFAKKAGKTGVAGLVLQGALGTAAAQALQQGAKAAGLPYKGTVTLPISATDYAPYIQKLAALHADAIGTQLASAQFLLFTTAAAQAGETWQIYPPAVAIATNFFSAMSKQPAEIARVTPMSAVPPADPSIASTYSGVSKYLADIKAYEATSHDSNAASPDYYTEGSISSWQAVMAVAQILKTVSGTPSTSSFVSALTKSGPIDTGLGPAWNPPPPKGPSSYPQVTNGAEFAWSLKGGKYTLADPQPVDVFKLLGLK
jgi:ABC-type branched-subunit amino acid transport system substrate-binding protein